MAHAINSIIPHHVAEVRARRLPEVDKVESEVTIRLKKEINYWDHRAQDLKAQDRAGKQTRLSSVNAEARANDLADRLERRLSDLARERDISALTPIIRGGAIVIPCGLITLEIGGRTTACAFSENAEQVEKLAMAAVMAAERVLGHEPREC